MKSLTICRIKKCSIVFLSISFGLWPILWKDKSICFSSVFLILQSLHKIKVNMYSTSTFRIKKGDFFFERLASFFWCWWTWKEVHQVMFLASVVAPFWWSPTWKLCDTYLYLSQLVCHAILNKSLRTRKKMGDKFFRIIASPFACAKLVCCCILVIRQEIGVS